MAAAQIEMTVRRPPFDYERTPRNWMPGNPDFGYRLNGGSLTLPYLEPYLIRVMRMAKDELGEAHSALKEFELARRDADAAPALNSSRPVCSRLLACLWEAPSGCPASSRASPPSGSLSPSPSS